MRSVITTLLSLLFFILIICTPHSSKSQTIQKRFSPPHNFERTETTPFGNFLRQLPLHDIGYPVHYYDGSIKPNRNIYVAVVDQPIENRDLQQCGDAILRLKAEYHYARHEFDSITFKLTNGFSFEFSKWQDGNRLVVNGNKTSWKKSAKPSSSRATFDKYLTILFSYAGTHSLEKELQSIAWSNMRIGDILIKGGFPGHSVIIVDIVVNIKTGEKRFLLAQSYMPAQETQILVNPYSIDESPWYSDNIKGEYIQTPEWVFKTSELMRF